jgi:hypothetical protein
VRITLIATGFNRSAKQKGKEKIGGLSRDTEQQSLLPVETELPARVDLDDPNVPAYLRAAASADTTEKI